MSCYSEDLDPVLESEADSDIYDQEELNEAIEPIFQFLSTAKVRQNFSPSHLQFDQWFSSILYNIVHEVHRSRSLPTSSRPGPVTCSCANLARHHTY